MSDYTDEFGSRREQPPLDEEPIEIMGVGNRMAVQDAEGFTDEFGRRLRPEEVSTIRENLRGGEPDAKYFGIQKPSDEDMEEFEAMEKYKKHIKDVYFPGISDPNDFNGNRLLYGDQEARDMRIRFSNFIETGRRERKLELREAKKMPTSETGVFIKGRTEQLRRERPDMTEDEINIAIAQELHGRRNPYDPGESSFTEWDDDTKKTAIQTMLLTGKPPRFANRDAKGRAAFEKATNEYMNQAGITPAELGSIQTAYKALDRSAIFQQKQLNAAGSFVRNMDKQITYAQTLFDELSRTDARLLNVPIRQLRMKLAGSGLESAYQMFVKEISAEATKLSMNSQASIAQIPEGNRKEWEEVHDLDLPMLEMKRVLDATNKAAQMRYASIQEELGMTTQQIRDLQSLISPRKEKASDVDLMGGKGQQDRGLPQGAIPIVNKRTGEKGYRVGNKLFNSKGQEVQ